jgi:putative transposase
VIGTIRRECLDWLIPPSEAHLRSILKEWVAHYNGGRCHGALGPGVPDPPSELSVLPESDVDGDLNLRNSGDKRGMPL